MACLAAAGTAPFSPTAAGAAVNYKLSSVPTFPAGSVYSSQVSADSTRVVYLADQDTDEAFELYSRAIDGSGVAVKLNAALAAGGSVSDFRISDDSTRVVYRADQDVDGVYELYSRAIDGSGAAVKLNGTLAAGGNVHFGFQISADSTRVVYVADQDADEVYELYSRAIDGSGAAVKLNGAMVAGGDIRTYSSFQFQISADSTRVVYLADQDADEVFELYSRAIDGSGAVVKLNGALVAGGDVAPEFRTSADSTWVVYRADQDVNDVVEIYSRAIDGSGAVVKLNASLVSGGFVSAFQISDDSARVVYRAVQDTAGVAELYSRAIDGSGAAVKLNGALAAGGNVSDLQISADSTWVVYRADQDADEVFEVYSRPIDGSGAAVKLSGALVSGGDVYFDFQISADSTRVVYSADQDADEVFELYSRAIDGSGAAVKLNGALVSGGDVYQFKRFQIAADSTRVVYLADQDANGVNELYGRAIDGSGTSVKLNGLLVAGFGVSDFQISADSTRVVYSAVQDAYAVELYGRAIDGSGTPVKLNGTLVTSGKVSGFRITADSTRVVYQADQHMGGAPELYSRSMDGTGAAVKLNGVLVAGGFVDAWQISADSMWVVYWAVQDTIGVHELYSRATDGSGAVVKLYTPPASVIVSTPAISPDSTRVVYLGDPDADGAFDLYSRAIDGSGAAVKLNGALVTGSGISVSYQISADSTRVVYLADQDTDGVYELYSRAIDGSGAVVKLNGALVSGGDVSQSSGFRISADSTRVVYRADQDTDGVDELYSRAIDGSGAVAKLNGPLAAAGDVGSFQISADSTRVVYMADQDTDGVDELYSRAIDGSGAPVKLNGALVSGGDVFQFGGFQISPDSARVVYRADEDTDGVDELYSRAIDGSGTVVKLNGTLVAGGGIGSFQISPDSTRVVYGADQDVDQVFELYSRAIDGLGALVKLNGTLAAGGGAGSFRISPDSARVVYRADQDTDGIDELYSRAIDGSGAVVKLNGAPATGGVDLSFAVTPDSKVVTYIANQDGVAFELWATGPDCGDAVVDPSEECDAGSSNGMVGSCCDTDCTPVSAATPCLSDGDACTLDQCNGAAVCVHPDNGLCETGNVNVPPGGSINTDTENDGATPSDPVETAITVPGGGTVTIEERPFTNSPDGFFLFGNEVEIDAPNATAANPLVMAFRLDASVLFPQPFGQDEIDVGYPFVFKDSALVPNCSGDPGEADPDPCIQSRVLQGDGDVILTVLTSTASLWQFAVPTGECPDTVDGGCVIGFAKAFLLVKENVPGKEKLVAKLGGGPALDQTDIGNPLSGDDGGTGTMVSLCIYDGNGNLAGELVADGPTSTCAEGAPCWKSIGNAPNDPNGPGKGYAYKDTNADTDGLQKLLYKSGEAGKPKAIVKAKGPSLPLGIPAALQSSAQATIQLRSSDGECLSATVTDIKKQEAGFFKGK